MKVILTAHQKKLIAEKMKTGGYLSPDEIIREAFRVYQLVEQEDTDPELQDALREALRSPLKKYTKHHFAKLGGRSRR